jgi:succinate dehydrogenase / fumarate reductase cytochrome b subunit
VASVLVGIHLYHGIWSMFQSMGVNNPRFNKWRRYLASTLSTLISVGFIAPVAAVVLGVLR